VNLGEQTTGYHVQAEYPIWGEEGDDILYGDDMGSQNEGHDTLYAGSGVDVLYGGAGDDHLYAIEDDSDQDLLYGGDGDDTLFGGTGRDILMGERQSARYACFVVCGSVVSWRGSSDYRPQTTKAAPAAALSSVFCPPLPIAPMPLENVTHEVRISV
jgi:Ca2+-binding RTX toxin-like protein